MKRLLLVCTYIFFLHAGNPASPTNHEIDQRITELREEKRGYEARALYHESVGERLQFVDGELLVARRHFRLAEENRKKAALLQEEIEALEKQKK